MRPEMVKAILDGTKTETRRADQLKGINKAPDEWQCYGGSGLITFRRGGEVITIRSRYHVGETVYVRETWAAMAIFDGLLPRDLHPVLPMWFKDTNPEDPTNCGDDVGKWRSPLHLRADMARLFLHIDGVEAQRLLSMTRADALAEGIPCGKFGIAYLMDDYLALWDRINPTMPSETNPFVFRYCFHRVDKEGI